jgi:23S rRNA pseudouridine1911/1915/1917 synthase
MDNHSRFCFHRSIAMPTDRTYHIRPVLDGQTLAAGLRGLNAELSWAEAKRLIQQRHVQVNGNLVLDETRRVKAGDVVKVFASARAPVPTDRDVRVVHVDEDLIVVDKPAGITTLRHAEERGWEDRRKQLQPTLDEVVQRLIAAAPPRPSPSGGGEPGRRAEPPRAKGEVRNGVIRRPGGRPPPPASGRAAVPKVRPVHRLDRDTSGLMLFALSPRAEVALVKMFKGHTIERSYVAVVHGRVAEPLRIESYIARDRGDGLRGSTPSGREEPGSQHAVTHVEPVEPVGGDYTIVGCQLETGRTHQIRIHLAEAGHMLCGEKTYIRPRPSDPPVVDASGAPRQALHSADLRFTHPISGQAMQFTAPLAKDLAQWLARMKAGKSGGS